MVNRRKDGSKYLADPAVDHPGRRCVGAITNYLGIQRDVTDLHRLEYEVGDPRR